MAGWAYATLLLKLELREGTEKYRDWTLQYADNTFLEGLDNILNSYGRAGWELVSVLSEHADVSEAYGYSATTYRAFFKRPLA